MIQIRAAIRYTAITVAGVTSCHKVRIGRASGAIDAGAALA